MSLVVYTACQRRNILIQIHFVVIILWQRHNALPDYRLADLHGTWLPTDDHQMLNVVVKSTPLPLHIDELRVFADTSSQDL